MDSAAGRSQQKPTRRISWRHRRQQRWNQTRPAQQQQKGVAVERNRLPRDSTDSQHPAARLPGAVDVTWKVLR